MEKINWGKTLFAYLKARRAVMVYVASLFAILFAVYGLYRYPWGVAFYTALVCLVVTLGFGIWDFIRFASVHGTLAQLPGRYPLGPLPEPRNLIDEDWAELVRTLEAARLQLSADSQRRVHDAQEYYTLWAHQIKTPIAAMSLLLQNSNADGGAPADRAALEAELFSVEQYVGMVMQYQRLASLNADLVLHCHELNALVKRAVKNLAPMFIRKKLSLHLEELAGSVVTDEKWFVFVLEQLFTNALKYTHTGGITVEMQSPTCLAIRDTGIGILPEDLPRVFDRGYTGAIGRQEDKSSGIGLYLCRQILTRLGFSISLESRAEPPTGTTVLIGLAQQVREEY